MSYSNRITERNKSEKDIVPNLHYLFYIDYYKKLNRASFQKQDNSEVWNLKDDDKSSNDLLFQQINDELTDFQINPADPFHPVLPGYEFYSFHLQTVYPGLLAGTGYPHDSGLGDNEIKLGFSIDPITGMPYLPSTGVKGVLRSAFRSAGPFVESKLNDILGVQNFGQENIHKLEISIFGPWCHDKMKIRSQVGSPMWGDIFLDAVAAESHAKGGRIFALDNITPHVNKKDSLLDGLTEPVPLTMLRVCPGVKFRFSFLLRDSMLPDGGKVTASQKLTLFKAVIEELGIGAKTATGYGYLEAAERQDQVPAANLSKPKTLFAIRYEQAIAEKNKKLKKQEQNHKAKMN